MTFILVGLCSTPALAGSWTGVLVDGKCYANEESNVNPDDIGVDAARDRNLEVRYCRPTPHTKSFTLVQPDGQSFVLDAAGNQKAAGIAARAPKKSHLVVTVNGEANRGTIAVTAVSFLR